MSEDCRVDVLVKAVDKLEDGRMKDALTDDLQYAKDINGTTDPALKGIKRLLISGVRRELLSQENIDNAIEKHTKSCANNKRAPSMISLGKDGIKATGTASKIAAGVIVLVGLYFLHQWHVGYVVKNNVQKAMTVQETNK